MRVQQLLQRRNTNGDVHYSRLLAQGWKVTGLNTFDETYCVNVGCEMLENPHKWHETALLERTNGKISENLKQAWELTPYLRGFTSAETINLSKLSPVRILSFSK